MATESGMSVKTVSGLKHTGIVVPSPPTAGAAEAGKTIASHATSSGRLYFNGFIGVGLAGNGINDVGARFGAAAFVVGYTVLERIEHLVVVVVADDAEGESGILVEHVVEVVEDVVVELFGTGLGVHGYDRMADGVGHGCQVLFDEVEVGHCCGVVVLKGIGVDAGNMDEGGVETEVVVAEDGVIDVFTGAKAIVIANDAYPRHLETVEYGTLPYKFFSQPEVGEVAGVDDKVDVTALVDGVNQIFGFVIPALRVADLGEAQGVLADTLFLNACRHLGGKMGRPVETGVIGMIFYEVAPLKTQQYRPENEATNKEFLM